MATKKATSTGSGSKRASAGGSSRSSSGGRSSSEGGSTRRRSAPRAAAPRRKSAAAIAAAAVEQLTALTGKQTEGVTSLESTDDGWTVEVEVVELRRIPNTTDVLATYEVLLDQGGELQGYRRLRRYGRSESREDQ
ncbi:gas vesicle protein GvpO [Nocardioides sp.]|uniref:gas vesicle protein GvpO n=1 Tax=Nocardioides sp. TaxID=35761 RepID=UPI00273734DE|nr:gas vesicle protein GvpO [Nocardioides sp.]MDP3893126.1 gas vesicle protein GvpO [Nocardioides sp.]